MTRWRLAAAASAVAMTSLPVLTAHADTRVGVTGAVNPAAAGTPPGGASRQLTVGSEIIFRERVVTTEQGQAQILFLDQSSLLIGPDSTVVIDEFVYDPTTKKGNMAATLTQGSFRYIGGKLSKQGNATLKTPVATLGIRGSDVTVAHDLVKALTNIVTTHGSATVTMANEVIALRGGFGLTVSGSGAPLGGPTALTAQQIAAANRPFEGQPGKTGGAGPLTDDDVAKSGLSSAIEAQQLAGVEPAAGGGTGDSGLFNVPFSPGTNDTQPKILSSQGSTPPTEPPPVTKTDRVLNGYLSGLVFYDSDNDNLRHAVTNAQASDVHVETVASGNGTGRVFATFKYRSVNDEGLATAMIVFGDPSGASGTKSVFTNDTTFQATQSGPASAGFGELDGHPADASGWLMSVSAPLCACEYVNWGMWQARLETSDDVHEVKHGFWVAGQLPKVTDPSPKGEAVFSGTAIGWIYNPGGPEPSPYLRSGQFTNKYNFDTRTGRVDIKNFDGKSFGADVKAISQTDWRSYSGQVSGAGLTGRVAGSFYGNGTAVAKNTAGNFNVRGSNGYTASGIFAGTR
jgi:hypothetical protein